MFARRRKTEILLISEPEKKTFIQYHDTPESRFHVLPPGIDLDRIRPPNAGAIRDDVRRECQLTDEHHMVLSVGSNYKKKGVGRSLIALASLPRDVRANTFLFAIGKDKPDSWLRLAKRLGLSRQVRFLGLREDVPRFLLAADLFLHPAYRENTGTVLLEALVAGLPVLATEACGHASHIERSGAGLLVPSPYRQEVLNERLSTMLTMLTSDQRGHWRQRALDYTREADVFSLVERAAENIEAIVKRRPPGNGANS